MSDRKQDLPQAWRGILRGDERILWQGAPQEAFHFKRNYASSFIAAFAMIAVVIYLDLDPIMVIFVMIIGALTVIGAPIWDAIRRHYSFFTLTEQRAFIGTDMPVLSRSLKSYPIDAGTQVDYRPGPFDTIYFAHEMHRNEDGEYRVEIGFENLRDGRAVYDLIQQIKKGKL